MKLRAKKLLGALLSAALITGMFPAAVPADEGTPPVETAILSGSEISPDGLSEEQEILPAEDESSPQTESADLPASEQLPEEISADLSDGGESSVISADATDEESQNLPAAESENTSETESDLSDADPEEPFVTEEDPSETASAEEEIILEEEFTEEELDAMGAGSGSCGENLTWTLEGNTLTISGTGNMTNFYASSTSTDIPWYDYRNTITSVVVESGVTSIGDRAFQDCTALTNVSLPVGLTKIGMFAFYNCTSLQRITIPSTVTNMGYRMLNSCSSLNTVFFTGNAPAFQSEVFNHDTITAYYPADDSTWTESKLQDYGGTVTWLDRYKCGDNLTWKFSSGRVTVTGSGDMWDFSTFSPGWMAYPDSIKDVVFDYQMTHIGDYAFYGCPNLTEMRFTPSGGYSLETIGQYAFAGCTKLKSARITFDVETIGDYAFLNCRNLNTLEMSNNSWDLETIGTAAFMGCESLPGFFITDYVTDLGDQAFSGCTALKTIRIGNKITSIGSQTFRDCTALSDITFSGSAPATIANDAFTNVSSTAWYPWDDSSWTEDVKQDYGGNITWKADNRCGDNAFWTLEDGVLTISGTGAMWDYSGGGLGGNSLPSYARAGATITSAVIENGITQIGKSAFYNLEKLEKVTISDSVTAIGVSAFKTCRSLDNVKIPSGITIIPVSLFEECSSLTNVSLPEGITSIGVSAFEGCSSLQDIFLPDSLTEIGSYAFHDCSVLRFIEIPAGVSRLPRYSFYNCSSMTGIAIPKKVVWIEEYAFEHCTNLSDVYYNASESDWNSFYSSSTGNEPLNTAEKHYNYFLPMSEITTTPSKYVGDGTAKKPSVSVSRRGKKLVQGTDYTVSYQNNKDYGPATVTVTGKGDYSGSMTGTFYIMFKDVTNEALFYFIPVYWAAGKKITTGYSGGLFKPMGNCNRAAVVTFLWRLAGRPEPSKMAKFKDMTGNNDFDKAISWAAEKGITTGFDDNTFRPWNTCNRAAIVTFLWRYAGKPAPGSMAGFSDMTSNADFNKSISWAAENGIVTGWEEDNSFRPWNDCRRLAIVTFLYRFDHL